jgi:hypothetical protein
LGNTACFVSPSDFGDLPSGELASAVRLAFRWILRADSFVPALRVHIVAVVCGGADEEVSGVDAPSVVAAVTDEQTIGDFADVEFVADTVREERTGFPRPADLAVARVRETRAPLPTAFATAVLGVEAGAELVVIGV